MSMFLNLGMHSCTAAVATLELTLAKDDSDVITAGGIEIEDTVAKESLFFWGKMSTYIGWDNSRGLEAGKMLIGGNIETDKMSGFFSINFVSLLALRSIFDGLL